MVKLLSLKFAIDAMLILLVLVLCYHVLILTELIPYQVVWGGRIETKSQMYVFETISIVINLVIFTIILLKGAYIKTNISIRAINISLWIITAVFVLNTIGNLFSNNFLEMIIFTPLTYLSSIFCYRMAVEKEEIER